MIITFNNLEFMIKLNTQEIIKNFENKYTKKIFQHSKLGIMSKLELKLLKETKKEFNFMKEQLLLKKIVWLIQQ